ncbi:PREDICTED: uncharacterized protein LOC109147685 isoform X2 [Ipomoea nil]|uniref:uncharacterized protein LOC109147685 isoform X2 n=1 Tax=Ipomoea nil TaxID=35883 RepID=UPI000901AE1F|nr:PREDICTED: uncharacterized protein LOC109147685 isoform X2 [Ipomoea nil]
MATIQSEKPAQQSDNVQPSAVITTQKANKTHQSCREKVKGMANKMFHHNDQHGNLQAASNGQGHHQSANQACQTPSAERKKKETNCMPNIRARMKIIKKKKNNEAKTGDTSSNSSSSDEGDQGQGARKKN